MTTHSTDTDVLDVLVTDHREALELVAEIRSATSPQSKRDQADSLISELVRHSVAEETFVYPVMKAHLPDGEQAVQRDITEHKQLEATMKELEGTDASLPKFTELMNSLEATLRDHVQSEENEQFPKLRQAVPHDELVDLKSKVEAMKKIAPTRPHPNAPNSALFHILVGPGVGLVDRLRDKLTGRST
jgi:hemerythrin superfamily protein